MFLDNIKKRPNTFTTTALFQKNDIPIFTETEILKAISDKKNTIKSKESLILF